MAKNVFFLLLVLLVMPSLLSSTIKARHPIKITIKARHPFKITDALHKNDIRTMITKRTLFDDSSSDEGRSSSSDDDGSFYGGEDDPETCAGASCVPFCPPRVGREPPCICSSVRHPNLQPARCIFDHEAEEWINQGSSSDSDSSSYGDTNTGDGSVGEESNYDGDGSEGEESN